MKRLMLIIFASFVGLFCFSLQEAVCESIPNMLNFQGMVSVDGQPFTGNGQFKFALLNSDGTETYWSNDASSINGSEPVSSVSVFVRDGIYGVLLGSDATHSIPNSLFSERSEVFLRVWFNDNFHGFEQLKPDQRIVSVAYSYRAAVADTVKGGGATLTVASTTSRNKQIADYVCDGIDDHIEINAAIRAVADSEAKRGTVKLLDGQFNIGAPIVMYAQKIRLEGSGCKGTLLFLQSNRNCNVIEVSINSSIAQVFFDIVNININGNASQNASGWGIYVDKNPLIKDVHIADVSVTNTKTGGIFIGSPWGHVAENVVSEFSLGIGYEIDNAQGIEAKLSNVKIMANAGTQLKITSTAQTTFSAVKVVNGRFMAANNNTRVLDIGATGNVFVNCDVGAANKSGVTLLYCSGTRNSFTNMVLSGPADTVTVHFPASANGNYFQGITSIAVSGSDRITVINEGMHNRIILPVRGSGFTWVDSGARLDNPLIGDGTDKTIYILFDNNYALTAKPGIRYNHITGKIQVSHNG